MSDLLLKKRPIQVAYANRAQGAFHSIEQLFRSIAGALPSYVKSSTLSAPHADAKLRSIVANLNWFRSLPPCDVVHQTGDIHYSILGRWNKPTVLTIHDLRFIDESKGVKWVLFWLGWLYLPCLRADRITVISESTKQRLLALLSVDKSKLRVIPNCVDPLFVATEAAWNADQPRLLLIGTTPNKNLERILEACRGLDVHFNFLGKLDQNQLELLGKSGLPFQEFHALSRAEVVALYQASNVVVFVSTYEGFGMPILEAQACGRPVLTSDISPMSDVAGDGALKVDPLDVEAIRSGLKLILADAQLRESLVAEGLQNVAKYSAESIATQYAELYLEMLEKR